MTLPCASTPSPGTAPSLEGVPGTGLRAYAVDTAKQHPSWYIRAIDLQYP